MIRAHQGRRIVWLVRLLTALGIVTVVMTTGLVGWTLTKVRRERARAAVEQDQLSNTALVLRERAAECESHLQDVLDEMAVFKNAQSVDAGLIELIRSQASRKTDAALRLPESYNAFVVRLESFIQNAFEWRGEYDAVWADLGQQRTLDRARNLITQLHASLASLEGRRRLDEAMRYKRWRAATGEDASQQARAILLEHARQQSQGLTADAIQGVKSSCLEAGMDDYLTKPINPNELFATLGRWIPIARKSIPSPKKVS